MVELRALRIGLQPLLFCAPVDLSPGEKRAKPKQAAKPTPHTRALSPNPHTSPQPEPSTRTRAVTITLTVTVTLTLT
eukprot:6598933-Prymnesium_polylepis.1